MRFHLTGIDVDGIEKTREVAAQQGWNPAVALLQGSGYDLADLFTPHSFDIAVATQVLEHVATSLSNARGDAVSQGSLIAS